MSGKGKGKGKTLEQQAADKAVNNASAGNTPDASPALEPEAKVKSKPSFQTENLNSNLDVQVCRIDRDGILETGYIPRGAKIPAGWHDNKFSAGVPKEPKAKAEFYFNMRKKIKARNQERGVRDV